METKKYYVFSDPHGHATILKQAIDDSGFNFEDNDHVLIGLGDYFDRGKENEMMFDLLKQYKERLQDRFIILLGNHDLMLMGCIYEQNVYSDYGNFLLFNGGLNTINHLLKRDVYDWFKTHSLFWYETDKYYFSHAGFSKAILNFDQAWKFDNVIDPKNPSYKLTWERPWENIERDKICVHGHTHAELIRRSVEKIKDDYSPYFYNNNWYIDSCTILSKRVYVLILE